MSNEESGAEPKAKSRSISLLPKEWRDVDLIAKKSFGNKVSPYIKALVEADIFHDAQGDAYSKLASRAKAAGDPDDFAAQLKAAFERDDVRADLIALIAEAVRAVAASHPGSKASGKANVRRPG